MSDDKTVIVVTSSELISELLTRFLERQAGIRCVATAHGLDQVDSLCDERRPRLAVVAFQPGEEATFLPSVLAVLDRRRIERVVLEPTDRLGDVLHKLGT